MDVFDFRNHLIEEYSAYINSFIHVQDPRIARYIQENLAAGQLWPDPLIQLNPSFEPGDWIDDLVKSGMLHPECSKIFKRDKNKPEYHGAGQPLRLHKHQTDAIQVAQTGINYVLTTGTGSGKSLAYIVPIVDHVLRRGSGRGVQAIVVYPMNALANSQEGELTKFLKLGYPDGQGPITFARYTGQESDETRQRIIANPPDIILTNYVMLELILTRPIERQLVQAAQGLRFLVLDELHTYRGRQGADVALLVRRVRDALNAPTLQCVGTSATLSSMGTFDEQRADVARVASNLFGAPVLPPNVIGETLRRATTERDLNDPAYVAELTARVADSDRHPPVEYEAFIHDPLSIWLESTFGITTETGTGRLVRARPSSITGKEGAALKLSTLTGVSVEQCSQVIEAGLMAGYQCHDPQTGFPAFAFRLHQFISRGDTVYASLETEETRHLTLYRQQYVPGDRSKVLLPLAFCRECGQEYYSVRVAENKSSGAQQFIARDLTDQTPSDDGEPGFLYFNTSHPWPSDPEDIAQRVPDDWLEDHQGGQRVRSDRKKHLPQPVSLGTDAMLLNLA